MTGIQFLLDFLFHTHGKKQTQASLMKCKLKTEQIINEYFVIQGTNYQYHNIPVQVRILGNLIFLSVNYTYTHIGIYI